MRDSTPPLCEERIAAYLRGELSATERAGIEAAIDKDPQWLAVVALLARTGDAEPGPEPSEGPDATVHQVEAEHAMRLRPGDRLGRYVVDEPLGRGGMGMVYAAHDPQLNRRVALKLLRGRDPRGQARLLREARALARLSDRHVITIHDVGTFGGRVFLAMELLEGQTLHAWRAAQPRTWAEVIAVFVDAGRGLVAAHEAGLVHRDFKPSNVMLTADDRVVVLDFGLAHTTPPDDASLHEPASTDRALDRDEAGIDGEGSLTQTGQLLGTPAYMAPEQRRGEPCGPRSDQFSFCVALHEALHGRRPAASSGASEAEPAIHRPATGRLPRRVTRLLATGLAPDPRARHPSMTHLVEALASVLHPTRQRLRLVVLAGLGGAGAAWALGHDPPAPAAPQPCTGSARALAETWSEARAADVARALGATGRPFSARVRDEVDQRLHAYGDAWVAEHEATCRAARVDGVDSEAVLDLRMACLDRRRQALGALVDVLREADAEVAIRAVQAVDALPPLSGCRDVEALRAPVPLPEDEERRARAEAIFDDLARVEALRQAQRYEPAAQLAARAVEHAVDLGHAPTEADARLASGWVLVDRGEHEAAETELRAALHAAERGHHDEGIALAWSRLAWVVGYKRARFDEGRQLARHAEAWTSRASEPVMLELSRLRTLGWIEHDAGNAPAAAAHFEAAVVLAERLPPDEPDRVHELALVLNGLGASALAAADLPRAAQSFSRAASLLESVLGPEHPDVAQVRNNLASLRRAQGQAEQALELLARNLAVFEATYGDDHPVVGQTLINLAVVELDLGRHSEAEAHAERSLQVLRAAHGPEHPMVAKGHTIRGNARVHLGRGEQALEDFELALDLETTLLGADHPSVGIIESNLGDAYYGLGRLEPAAAHQQRSLEILEQGLGTEHPHVAFVLVSLGVTRRAQGRAVEALALLRRAETLGDATLRPTALTRIGEVLLDQGRTDEAVEALEQATALYAQIEHDPGFSGDAHLALARALWAQGRRSQARDQARAALAAYPPDEDAPSPSDGDTPSPSDGDTPSDGDASSDGDTSSRARVEQWLDEHGAAGDDATPRP